MWIVWLSVTNLQIIVIKRRYWRFTATSPFSRQRYVNSSMTRDKQTSNKTKASGKNHIILEPLPHRNHNAHLPRRRRLARLLALAASLVAQHLAADRNRRLALLPLSAANNLRHAPLPLQRDPQKAALHAEHKRRRQRRPSHEHDQRSRRVRNLHTPRHTAYSAIPHRQSRPATAYPRFPARSARRIHLRSTAA